MAKKPKKPILRCNRCIRMWPGSDHFRPGCVSCYEARKAVKKPKDAIGEQEEPFVQETNEKPPESIVDDNGAIVPESLLPVFRMVKHFNDFERTLNKAAKIAKEIENVAPLKAKRPLSGKKHYGEMFGPIKHARSRVYAMRPAEVHAGCAGVGCDECKGSGYFTCEEVDARKKEIPL